MLDRLIAQPSLRDRYGEAFSHRDMGDCYTGEAMSFCRSARPPGRFERRSIAMM
jgi:hypothetical protein